MAFWLQVISRPKGKIKSFKTRYTPTVWTPEQMDYALQVFHRIWLLHFPTKKWKVKKVLDSLNIEWVTRRWRRDGVIAAAESISPTRLKLWRGPKIRGDRYKMSYTALPEGLIQIMVYNLDGRILDSNTITKQYRDVIQDIKKELEGQISHEIRSVHPRASRRDADFISAH